MSVLMINALMATDFALARADASEIAAPAVWQWSVPLNGGEDQRAFLWIPDSTREIDAVIFAQNNMLELGVLENPQFRSAMADLNIAEVWVAPMFDVVFRFDSGAGDQFNEMMEQLAEVSGYAELATAPVIPMGHSACASFPWNFAAWAPERTLAVISLKGDAPLTPMTGSGRPNPEWGDRRIDGVPGLMIMGEYEWVEGRLLPALSFQTEHPEVAIAMLAEPGRGHFETSQELIDFMAMFICKSVEQRLPDQPGDALIAVNPKTGWLVERWTLNQPRNEDPAPYAEYAGDRSQALWAFDEEMATAIDQYREKQIGKQPQLLGFITEDEVIPQSNTHFQVALPFMPAADGVTFDVEGAYLDEVGAGSNNLARWAQLPAGAPLGHPASTEEIEFHAAAGPVRQVGPRRFQLSYNRAASVEDRRQRDIWIYATHPGDDTFKSAVQQALVRVPEMRNGKAQDIHFAPMPDQKIGVGEVQLNAHSDSGDPVYFYVREGPAYVEGNKLCFTEIPPKSRLPMTVAVVAWQPPFLKSEYAEPEPVVQEFQIVDIEPVQP